jgi:hypothetical protein
LINNHKVSSSYVISTQVKKGNFLDSRTLLYILLPNFTPF